LGVRGEDVVSAEPQLRTDVREWERLVTSYRSFIEARQAVLATGASLVPLLESALSSPTERTLALDIIAFLPLEERKQLLGPLVSLASFGHGQTSTAREAILSMPHEWLKKHIDALAEPILARGDEEEYRRLLELYIELDRSLALRLARRASASDDDEVADVGKEFLSRLAI
jgi:hypothetical protein